MSPYIRVFEDCVKNCHAIPNRDGEFKGAHYEIREVEYETRNGSGEFTGYDKREVEIEYSVWYKLVAVTKQKKQWACKQVAVHGVHSDKCLVRDMEYNYFGYGYRVGWFAEELQSVQKRFEDGKWYAADTKYYDPYAPLINRGVISKIPEYKYSAYRHYTGRDIISYLRIYERFPQTEYMLKNGLCAYAENISLLKKFGQDKKFCKWFIRHRKELALPYGNTYNVTAIREAYKTGRPLDEVKHFLFAKKRFEREARFNPVRRLFPGWKLKT